MAQDDDDEDEDPLRRKPMNVGVGDEQHLDDPLRDFPDVPVGNDVDLAQLRGYVAVTAAALEAQLAKLIEIPSISSDFSHRADTVRTAHHLRGWIQQWCGGRVRLVEPGIQETEGGEHYPIPPVLLVGFGDDDHPDKPTLLVVGHYDVLPAHRTDHDGWTSEDPFTLHAMEFAPTKGDFPAKPETRLLGRGTASSKGPILAWIWAALIFHRAAVDLPVNLKMLIQGMEESESECLPELIRLEFQPAGFLYEVDFVTVLAGTWADHVKPSLIYGLRGLVTAEVEVRGGSRSLHSGSYGGVIHEPMHDLVQLLASLSDGLDDISIEGVGVNAVPPVSTAELQDVHPISLDVEQVKRDAGGLSFLTGDDKEAIMMNRTRFPALTIHGIDSSTSRDACIRRVIPNVATAKLSIRLAPPQQHQIVQEALREHLNQRFSALETPNTMTITAEGSDPWLTNPDNLLFESAVIAFGEISGTVPDFIRDGFTSVAASELSQQLEVPVLVLPVGPPSCNLHSEDENIPRKRLVENVHIAMTMIDELARGPQVRGFVSSKRRNRDRARLGPLNKVRSLWYGLS